MDETNLENIIEKEKDNSHVEGNLDEDKQMSVGTEEQRHMKLRDQENINKPVRHRNAFYSSCNDPIS